MARLGDGWLASAYNITPAGFAAASALLRAELAAGRPADGFPHALVTMWAWITEERAEADRIITHRLAPLLRRDPATLRGRVCVGPAGMCAELLSRIRQGGVRPGVFLATRRGEAPDRPDRVDGAGPAAMTAS